MINVQGMLIHRYNVSQSTSSFFFAAPYCIGAFLMSFFGGIGDRFGKRGFLLTFGSVLLVIAYSMFYFKDIFLNPNIVIIISITLIGLYYSILVSTIFPCFSLVCLPELIGTGFGI